MPEANTEMEARIQEELQRLRARPPVFRSADSVGHGLERVFFRALRIAVGVALFLIALYFFGNAREYLDKPLGGLTLGDLFGLVFFAGLGLLFVLVAFLTAFGEGPSASREERMEAKARANVKARLEGERAFREVQDRGARQMAAVRRAVALLFNPKVFARSRRWLPWVIVPIFIVGVVLVAAGGRT